MTDLAAVVAEIAAEMAARPDRGEVAHYIPELARVDRMQDLQPPAGAGTDAPAGVQPA